MSGRPVQLTYSSSSPRRRPTAWSWSPARRAFVKADGDVTVSPGGRWEAVLLNQRYPDRRPSVRFTDRESGKKTEVELPVAEDPERGSGYLNTLWPTWSPDGRTLLVNVFEPGFEPRSAGVVLIDVPSLRPRFVRIEKALITVGGFQWTRDSKGLVVRWGKNGRTSVRRYDLEGAVERTRHVRGRPVGHGLGTFSPSGRRFVTACTSLERSACVWDTATGRAVTASRPPSAPCGARCSAGTTRNTCSPPCATASASSTSRAGSSKP